MQTIELTDGGVLLVDDMFLSQELADRCFAEIREGCNWEQKPGVFGHRQPRLTAAHGEPGVCYRYSGTVNVAAPWLPTLSEIRSQIETVQGRYNFCLINRYRTGQDSMGWHADDEREMGSIIASISLGAARKFRLKHNVTKEILTFELGHRALLIMSGTTQQFWKHEVPKTRKPAGERINLTFREIKDLPCP